MKKLIFSMLAIASFGFAEVISDDDGFADCLILQDENSIICKYWHTRVNEDKEILVQWIDPDGLVSRQREMVIPAGHGTIYDFRYIKGRKKGNWHFKVKYDDTLTTATFELK